MTLVAKTRSLATLAGRSAVRFLCRQKGFQPLPEPELVGSTDTVGCLPALYVPEQLDRVVSCGFERTLKSEVEKLRASCFVESPIEKYELGESLIIGGQVVTKTARHFFGRSSAYEYIGKPILRLDQANLANTLQGTKYFGHWLRDDCAMFEYLRETPPPLISMRRGNWPDGIVYEKLFSQTWQETSFASIGALTVFRELGFSRSKAERLQILRRRIRQTLPSGTSGDIVFIARGASGASRAISNADALMQALEAAGVRILEPETGTEDLLRALLDAELVISVEGSQAGHALYGLKERGALLILQPPSRFYNPHHEWARLLGMGYGIVVGEQEKDGFQIRANEVLAMVDRLLIAPRIAEA